MHSESLDFGPETKNLGGSATSLGLQAKQRCFCRAQSNVKEEKVDRRRGGK